MLIVDINFIYILSMAIQDEIHGVIQSFYALKVFKIQAYRFYEHTNIPYE